MKIKNEPVAREINSSGTLPGAGAQRGDWHQSEEVWITLAFKSDFKAERLAGLCGVSIRTLQRHFALKARDTITAWLQRIRLHEAYRRLKAGSRVKEVAYDLGFTQLSHFSLVFKKAHGISPSFLNGSRLSLSQRMLPRASQISNFPPAFLNAQSLILNA